MRRRRGGLAGRRFRYVRRGVYLLLALVFLAGYAAAYLPPRWFWWTGLAAVNVPYTSMLVVALSPLVLWRFRSAGRLFHSALLLLIVLRFVIPAMPLGQSEEAPGDLVLMTFNAPVRGPHPDTLRSATLQLIRQEHPDVLALQEPTVSWEGTPPQRRATAHVQALIDSLGYTLFTPPETAGNRFEQPVLICADSALWVESVRQITLPPAAGSDKPAYVTRIQFRWQGRPAVLYNLHLHTTGERKPWQDAEPRPFDPFFWRPYLRRYRDAYQRRVWEVRQLTKLLEAETLPVIVAGDLNSTMHHWEYRQLVQGFRDAFIRRGRGWGATYHARLPLVRIDHVLVSRAWEVVTAHVPRSHAFSDHRPVVVRLRWRTETPYYESAHL